MTKDELDKLFAWIAQSAKSIPVSTPTGRVASWSPQTQQMPKKVQKVERDLTDLHAAWEPCPAVGKAYYVPRRNTLGLNSWVLRVYPPNTTAMVDGEGDWPETTDQSKWRLIHRMEFLGRPVGTGTRLLAEADTPTAVLIAGMFLNWGEPQDE